MSTPALWTLSEPSRWYAGVAAVTPPQMRAIDPPPAGGDSMWIVLAAVGIAAGIALVVAALWVLWGGRVEDRSPEARAAAASSPSAAIRWRAGLTPATRSVIGLCLMVLGYHAAAYLTPRGWFGLMVPPDRWWLLIGGIALAVGGSLIADRVVGTAEDVAE